MSDTATLYQTEYTQNEARIAQFNTILDKITQSGLKSYELRSGDGSQKGERWSLKEVSDEIDRLQYRNRFLYAKLYGPSMVALRFRRKS